MRMQIQPEKLLLNKLLLNKLLSNELMEYVIIVYIIIDWYKEQHMNDYSKM